MEDIYRSQFRLPYGLYEKLKAEADKAGRSVNAELVARLEQSLSAGSDDADIVMVFDILGRLSERNPHLRYSFAVTSGEGEGEVEKVKHLAAAEVIHTPAPGVRRASKSKG